MGATTVFSLLVLWMTLLPLEGRTIGSQLRADSSSPGAQYQAQADAVVADLQKLASAKSPSSREAAVDLLHHFSQSPKRRAFDNSPPHRRSSKRAVFDILPHRLRVEKEAQTSSRLVRSFSSSRILKVEVANQSKLKNLIKKLIRKYILIEKKMLRNGRSADSSVLPHHTTSSSISM